MDSSCVIAMQYTGPGKEGDFAWMIEQPQYKDYLFVFNDTLEDQETARAGAVGSAMVRSYNSHSGLARPRSTGMPTFSMRTGPFINLQRETFNHILKASEELHKLVIQHNYTHVVFCADDKGVFAARKGCAVDAQVLDWITKQIRIWAVPRPREKFYYYDGTEMVEMSEVSFV